jgi:uncharacterized lipoprotein YajG
MSAIDRRTFILAGLGAAVSTALLIGCRAQKSVALAPDNDPLAAVGRSYLADHPHQADLGRLVAAVPALAGAASRTEARRALGKVAAAAQRDFAAGRVVSVGTWRLAESEARAAAVVALLPA